MRRYGRPGQPQQQYKRKQNPCSYQPHHKRFLPLAFSILLCTFLFSRDVAAQNNDTALAITGAGIQSSEDAPFVSPSFRFLPGDFVYATFQIANFVSKRETSESPAKLSLKYEAKLEDESGQLLAPTETGSIDEELSAEDKNWTPKRRVSFSLPSFIGAGKAKVHIVVKDLLGKKEASRALPFSIGGVLVLKADALSVQNLQFFRKENDSEPLELAAFSPGDTVFARFNMTGFKTGEQNTYRVVYDVLVQRPDGKPYIQQPHAAELSAGGFYPAQYLPATLQLTTSKDSAKGTYAVTLTVHDLVANSTSETKTSFILE